jgi:proteasome lid subunit RPN8/RPN11
MKCETKRNTNNFQMLIPTKVWEQVYVMIHSTPKEIGALMSCIIEGTDILVTDIYIPKQTVTSTECLFDKNDQADIVFKVTMEDDNVINGWIHSHVNMHTAFSCTDDATIDKLLEYTDDYVISICVNKKQSLNGRVDYISHNKFGRFVETVDNIPVFIVPDNMDAKELTEIKEFVENDENVTERKVTVVQTRWNNKGNKPKTKVVSKQSECIDIDDTFDDQLLDLIPERIDALNDLYLPEMREILEDSFDKWIINELGDDDIKQWWVLQEFDLDYPEEMLKCGAAACYYATADEHTDLLMEELLENGR